MTQAGVDPGALSIPELQAEISRLKQENRQLELKFSQNKQRLHHLDSELRRKQFNVKQGDK